ncbi:MAG: pyruvate, phosphate dikinase [Nitrospirota bacterium]
MSDHKYVYVFADGKAEGRGHQKELLGGKGAGLAEMTSLGIPVPAGFTITTEVCTYYYDHDRQYPPELWDQVLAAMRDVEESMGHRFGDAADPLLLSVRSGARVSMPGMMDTVLNLGLNDETIQGLIAKSGNERFAWDAYRRFVTMFGDVVLGVPHHDFEKILEAKKQSVGAVLDTDLSADDLRSLIGPYKDLVARTIGKPFPDDPMEQLRAGINAVFDSWNVPRAITYRKLHGIPGDWGTAVNVMSMVFGNRGETSGTGVAFTRDPGTGERRFFGEYLVNAQGEDVVAGIRTPQPIAQLQDQMPVIYDQLEEIYQRLEDHYRDMQDIEFTVEEGKLYMLQTRTGKRTAQAAVRIACEMVDEGMIDTATAVQRVAPAQLDQLLHPRIDTTQAIEVLAKGLPASPGAAVGEVVFTADHAIEEAAKGRAVILVRAETSPDDVGGMHAAQGILTARGGMTSHAAVVARGMGKCCVAGCSAITVDAETRQFTVGDRVINEFEMISLNGSTGEVIAGAAKLIVPELSGDFEKLMNWADEYRTLKVRTNADTPEDARNAVSFGAEGIGLCRTEHMFFGEERLPVVQEMILAEDEAARRVALAKLLPFQRDDFVGLFRAMGSRPVTIRLLDPPLHEFLPSREGLIEEIATLRANGSDPVALEEREELLTKVNRLHELNPMLGHRGCRLGISFPEIYEMQVEAICAAAATLRKEGAEITPEIMIPLVGTTAEFSYLKKRVQAVAEQVKEREGVEFDYLIGTMIEIPRAALTADKIAEEAEFFSCGTNDLTQMTFGYSRDDAGVFLPEYVEKKILPEDPFQVLDQEGVGQLIRMAVERGRTTRSDLKVGICGEHGGEPSSIAFCHATGLDYVSCSPFRVPIARLAAAQAALAAQG